MKDIPMFNGTHGMASLVFREIAVTGRAYAVIRSVWNGKTTAFLQECLDFCRAVGAETVYAAYGTEELPAEHGWDMLRMEVEKDRLPQGNPVELEALCPENGAAFLEIYNRCFRELPGSSVYGQKDLQRLYDTDCAFLAKTDGNYAAVAEISEIGLESIGVLPEFRGLGYDLALTVLPMVPRKVISLKVASTNEKALALYDRLGFQTVEITERWWRLQ